MPVYQRHHIRYDGECMPDWTIELRRWMHKTITMIQRLKVTPEHYAELINFQHAITQAVNDMRMKLDGGEISTVDNTEN